MHSLVFTFFQVSFGTVEASCVKKTSRYARLKRLWTCNFGKCQARFDNSFLFLLDYLRIVNAMTVPEFIRGRDQIKKDPYKFKISSYQTLIKPSFVKSCLEFVCSMVIRVSQFLWKYFVKLLYYVCLFLYILLQICLCISASTLFRIITSISNMMQSYYLIFAIYA